MQAFQWLDECVQAEDRERWTAVDGACWKCKPAGGMVDRSECRVEEPDFLDLQGGGYKTGRYTRPKASNGFGEEGRV